MTSANLSLKKPLAGIAIPLFSIRSARPRTIGSGWGIGEILDLIPFMDFMVETRLSVLQLLPMNELAPGETSPYNALSAFAWDPIYLALDDWEDFQKSPEALAFCAGKVPYTEGAACPDVAAWDKSPTVCYEAIRTFKNHLFQIVFKRFKKEVWANPACGRAQAFKAFMEKEASWLEDYALFRVLYERLGQAWTDWPKSFQRRYPLALSQFSREAEEALLFIKYLQWACWEQWRRVREGARAKNILLMGDIPFMVSRNSADVWGDQKAFRQADFGGDTLGAPPDDFNPHGQQWGFPMFCWETMKKSDFAWWRERIRKADYDIIRLDHIVGFFRVWVFPKKEGTPHFEPSDEALQVERGRLFLKVLLEEAVSCGRMLIGEDLGVVPSFVRKEMDRLNIPGMKILRWQKEGDAFIDPRDYPALSLATSGTHDTASLAGWWAGITDHERRALLTLFDEEKMSESAPVGSFPTLIIRRLMEAGSVLVILPFQDILGEDAQINWPGILSDCNWRYRMPVALETLQNSPENKDKMAFLKAAIARAGRLFS